MTKAETISTRLVVAGLLVSLDGVVEVLVQRHVSTYQPAGTEGV